MSGNKVYRMSEDDRRQIEVWLDGFWENMKNGSTVDWGHSQLLKMVAWAYACGRFDQALDNVGHYDTIIAEIERNQTSLHSKKPCGGCQ